MDFSGTAQAIKDRIDADSYFSGLGITAIKSQFSRNTDVDTIADEVESSLFTDGIAIQVLTPAGGALERTIAGRVMMRTDVFIAIWENPAVNRKTVGGHQQSPETLIEETLKALLGHPDIYPNDELFSEQEGQEGIYLFMVRVSVLSALTPR